MTQNTASDQGLCLFFYCIGITEIQYLPESTEIVLYAVQCKFCGVLSGVIDIYSPSFFLLFKVTLLQQRTVLLVTVK